MDLRSAVVVCLVCIACSSRPPATVASAPPAESERPRPPGSSEGATSEPAGEAAGASAAMTAAGETAPADGGGAAGAGGGSTGEVRGIVAFSHSATAHDVLPGCKVAVRAKEGGAAVAAAVTDASGSYAFTLKPGKWVIDFEACRPESGRHPPAARREIVLAAGARVTANLTFSDGTRCLDASARLDAPGGGVPVAALRPGATIWVRARDGERVAAVVVSTRVVPVPPERRALRLELDDGRHVTLSAEHPLADGSLPRDLRPGDLVDGARVAGLEWVAYSDGHSYDVLTSRPLLPYLAGGIPLRSTMRP